MKKKALFIFMVIGVVFLFRNNFVSMAQNCLNHQPQPEYQNRQVFFENISEEFYGTKNYAEQLGLVNRSLKLNDTTSIQFEELIIPSKEAISRLKRKQTLTSFHNINQQRSEYLEPTHGALTRLY